MSAYMVSKEHIDALVDGGVRFHTGSHNRLSWYIPGTENNPMRRTLYHSNMDEVGQMLQDANLASVQARYPDTVKNPSNMPGPIAQYWQVPYAHETSRRFSPTELLVALRGFEYQACETSDWHESEAYAFCQALQNWLIQALPGYSDGPWEITSETRPLEQVSA